MSAELSIQPSQIGATLRSIVGGIVRQEQRAIVYACRAAAQEARTEVVRSIQALKPAPVDTGALVGSFRVTPTPDGADLQSIAPHAGFVEFGTKPHWAPLDPLVAWAGRKLREVMRKGQKRDDAAQALGRRVQVKIARYGTKGRHYFEMASHKFPEILQRRLAEAQARVK